MTSGKSADPRQTDPYATASGPSGRAAHNPGTSKQAALPLDLVVDEPNETGPRAAGAHGEVPLLPADWRLRLEDLMAAGRAKDVGRLIQSGLEEAENEVSRARAILEEDRRIRRTIERDRAALEVERDNLTAEREIVARQRARITQDRKAIEVEARELSRLRADLMRREGALRETLEREGRRAHTEPLPVIADHGEVLRPDPSDAETPTRFMAMLRQYRQWAGNPSYRMISQRAGGSPVASTIQAMLARNELPPRLDGIDAVIRGCGGTLEDREKFATAWRRLTL